MYGFISSNIFYLWFRPHKINVVFKILVYVRIYAIVFGDIDVRSQVFLQNYDNYRSSSNSSVLPTVLEKMLEKLGK